MIKKIIYLTKEKGIIWLLNRCMYGFKIRLLRTFPFLENLFERRIHDVNSIDVFNPRTDLIEKLLKNLLCDEKEKIIKEANDATNGIIRGFSSITLNYGVPFDWQLNPLTHQKTDKNKKWFFIPDFDLKVGDIKTIWEASRFGHFLLFARAYLLSGDKKYYEAFSKQLANWNIENKYSYGANFKCGQECSIRMINVLLASAVFKDIITEDDIENIKIIVRTSFKKVLSNFNYSYKCQKNNHVLSELCGMLAGAYCTCDNKAAKKAFRLLKKSIKQQFLDDGGYIQQSFVYQRVAFQDLEIAFILLEKYDFKLDDMSKQLINASLMQMYQLMDKNGDMPNYGSNDGSLIFPMTSCGYRDFRPSLNALYYLLNKSKLFKSDIYDEEIYWLGLGNTEVVDNVELKTSFFTKTGLYSFRMNNYWTMVVAKRNSHHMDNAHLDVWTNGVNILCDSGSFSYASKDGEQLLSTSAHNTIYCPGKEQLSKAGNFTYYGQPSLELLNITKDEIEFKLVFKSGYTHKRRITFSDTEITIFDESNNDFVSNFHSVCELKKKDDCIASKLFEIQTHENRIIISDSVRSLFYCKLDDIKKIEIMSKDRTCFSKIIIEGE